jgi:hypothetical protein
MTRGGRAQSKSKSEDIARQDKSRVFQATIKVEYRGSGPLIQSPPHDQPRYPSATVSKLFTATQQDGRSRCRPEAPGGPRGRGEDPP